ncbi:hypothetical protein LKR43_10105 [Pusillimonas sp. MFBS29]|uniref:hypothetical protein n=1 Tax=Pusillimonas sp. MFBS29 TaxID=2886690 RepID=UPI001D0FEAC7|nr:hypothetical protein [Pusillimonas sp. MFBS29]MCC2596692.1 hypothetical protein [Pusillimonas sp. MFBS29]
MAKHKSEGTAADDKKNTSLRLEKKTLKALKIRAIEQDTSVQRIIETLIQAYLETPLKKQ